MERRFFGALPVRRMVVEVVCQIYDVAIRNLVRHGRLVCREKQKRQRQTPAYRKCLPPDHSLVTRMWPNASDKNLPINYSTRGGGDLFPETVGIFPEHSQIKHRERVEYADKRRLLSQGRSQGDGIVDLRTTTR